MPQPPLHHIVRVRRSEDLKFVRPGLMDEVLVNANQLENSPESTATALRETTLPYSIDPVLTRFQMPEWWKNDRGETKRNYARLGRAYVKGTSIELTAGPLVQAVPSERDWSTLAGNVVAYQRERLLQIRPQMDLFREELRPVRVTAPALVALGKTEDQVNRLLAEASAEAAGTAIALPIIVPATRLADVEELDRLLDAVPKDGVNAYFIWTPRVTEELLMSGRGLLDGLLHLVSALAERGVPVGHLHATYGITALHDVGIAAAVHHMGWVDKGEPADERRGGVRSCQIYVPGVRHSLRFSKARDLGYSLSGSEFAERFCSCTLCTGAFDAGQHPLDLLLEDHMVHFSNGRDRPSPTGRATGLLTWHYLLARRQEVEAFSADPVSTVLARDIERAATLAGAHESTRLRRLAKKLKTA